MYCPSSPVRVLFECDFCEGVFHTVRALRAHRYKVHGIQSNAEVMVDIEHVDCQIHTVNSTYNTYDDHNSLAYTSDLSHNSTNQNGAAAFTDSDINEQLQPSAKATRKKRCKRIFSGKKRKKKKVIEVKKSAVSAKRRRLALDKRPACFESAVESKTDEILNVDEIIEHQDHDNVVTSLAEDTVNMVNEDVDMAVDRSETGYGAGSGVSIDVLMSIYGDECLDEGGDYDAPSATDGTAVVSNPLHIPEPNIHDVHTVTSSPPMSAGETFDINSSSILGSLPSSESLVSNLCEQDSQLTEPYEEHTETIPEQSCTNVTAPSVASPFHSFRDVLDSQVSPELGSVTSDTALEPLDDYHYCLIRDKQAGTEQSTNTVYPSLESEPHLRKESELLFFEETEPMPSEGVDGDSEKPSEVCDLLDQESVDAQVSDHKVNTPAVSTQKDDTVVNYRHTAVTAGRNNPRRAATAARRNLRIIATVESNSQQTDTTDDKDNKRAATSLTKHNSDAVIPPKKSTSQQTPRTKTKARLKMSLRRSPTKMKRPVNRSLMPFCGREAPTSDSPPHLIPIFAIPRCLAEDRAPRVPKVRLKRTNSTEFKAYVIPTEDEEEENMPSLELQKVQIDVNSVKADVALSFNEGIDNEAFGQSDSDIPPLVPLAYKMQPSPSEFDELDECGVPLNLTGDPLLPSAEHMILPSAAPTDSLKYMENESILNLSAYSGETELSEQLNSNHGDHIDAVTTLTVHVNDSVFTQIPDQIPDASRSPDYHGDFHQHRMGMFGPDTPDDIAIKPDDAAPLPTCENSAANHTLEEHIKMSEAMDDAVVMEPETPVAFNVAADYNKSQIALKEAGAMDPKISQTLKETGTTDHKISETLKETGTTDHKISEPLKETGPTNPEISKTFDETTATDHKISEPLKETGTTDHKISETLQAAGMIDSKSFMAFKDGGGLQSETAVTLQESESIPSESPMPLGPMTLKDSETMNCEDQLTLKESVNIKFDGPVSLGPMTLNESGTIHDETPVTLKESETPVTLKESETPVTLKESETVNSETPVTLKESGALHNETPMNMKVSDAKHAEVPMTLDDSGTIHEKGPMTLKGDATMHSETSITLNESGTMHTKGPMTLKESGTIRDETPMTLKESGTIHAEGPVNFKESGTIQDENPMTLKEAQDPVSFKESETMHSETQITLIEAATIHAKGPITLKESGTPQDETPMTLDESGEKHTETPLAVAVTGTRYICNFCGKIYTSKHHFVVHESKHKGGKLYECQSCDFTAVGKMDLEFHYRKEHQLTAAMAREAVRTCANRKADSNKDTVGVPDPAISIKTDPDIEGDISKVTDVMSKTAATGRTNQKARKPSCPWIQKGHRRQQHTKTVRNKTKIPRHIGPSEHDASPNTNSSATRNPGTGNSDTLTDRLEKNVPSDPPQTPVDKHLKPSSGSKNLGPAKKKLQTPRIKAQKRKAPPPSVRVTTAIDPYEFVTSDEETETGNAPPVKRTYRGKMSAKSSYQPVYKRPRIISKSGKISKGISKRIAKSKKMKPAVSIQKVSTDPILPIDSMSADPEVLPDLVSVDHKVPADLESVDPKVLLDSVPADPIVDVDQLATDLVHVDAADSVSSDPTVHAEQLSAVQCVGKKAKKKNVNKLFNHRSRRKARTKQVQKSVPLVETLESMTINTAGTTDKMDVLEIFSDAPVTDIRDDIAMYCIGAAGKGSRRKSLTKQIQKSVPVEKTHVDETVTLSTSGTDKMAVPEIIHDPCIPDIRDDTAMHSIVAARRGSRRKSQTKQILKSVPVEKTHVDETVTVSTSGTTDKMDILQIFNDTPVTNIRDDIAMNSMGSVGIESASKESASKESASAGSAATSQCIQQDQSDMSLSKTLESTPNISPESMECLKTYLPPANLTDDLKSEQFHTCINFQKMDLRKCFVMLERLPRDSSRDDADKTSSPLVSLSENLTPAATQQVMQSEKLDLIGNQLVSQSESIGPIAQPQVSESESILPVTKQPASQSESILPVTKQQASQSDSILPVTKQQASQSESILPVTKQQASQSDSILPVTKQQASQSDSILPVTKQHASQSESILPVTKQQASQSDSILPVTKQNVSKSESKIQVASTKQVSRSKKLVPVTKKKLERRIPVAKQQLSKYENLVPVVKICSDNPSHNDELLEQSLGSSKPAEKTKPADNRCSVGLEEEKIKHICKKELAPEKTMLISQDGLSMLRERPPVGIDGLKESPSLCRLSMSDGLSESPERRRPGLVHRRHLTVDDDDIGYHSSGSLDQVSYDESHDWASAYEAQPTPEVKTYNKKTEKYLKLPNKVETALMESHEGNSANIRSFMDALFGDSELHVKEEKMSDERKQLSPRLPVSKALEPGLQQTLVSNTVNMDAAIKVKEEPTDDVQDGKARKAVSSLVEKLGKFKLTVPSKSPTRCKNRRISSGRSKESMMDHSDRVMRSQKPNVQPDTSTSGVLQDGASVQAPANSQLHGKITSESSNDQDTKTLLSQGKSRSVWDCVVPGILKDPVISTMSGCGMPGSCEDRMKREPEERDHSEPLQTLPTFTQNVQCTTPDNCSTSKQQDLRTKEGISSKCRTQNVTTKPCSTHWVLNARARSTFRSCDGGYLLSSSPDQPNIDVCGGTGCPGYCDDKYCHQREHTRTRMVKRRRPLAGMYQKSAAQRHIFNHQPVQDIPAVLSASQQISASDIQRVNTRHSHTDDCLYAGCPV